MAVAKSFQEMEQICEPYTVSGKMYVQVRNPKTNTVRQVRWYTDAEYAKLYPEAKKQTGAGSTPSVVKGLTAMRPAAQCAKHALGFDNGPITIFRGDIDANQEWFEQSNARYCTWWGWYIVSTETVPAPLPSNVTTIPVAWEGVGNPDGSLKTESIVKQYIESLLYEESPSTHQGKIGERLDLHLVVTNVFKTDTKYGHATLHTMEDRDGNVYAWNTTTKSWAIGDTKILRGTVKEHITKRNVKTTVLTRCVEI